MRKIWILTLTVCLLFLFIGVLPVHGEADIYDNVLRLHILANSDSQEDQALKLKVRDAILESSEGFLVSCKSREEAAARVLEYEDSLLATAKRVIEEEGYDYPVRIELGEEEYPTRTYGSVCFPSGSYLSLRILIGNAEGENWWCVLFPPICASAATKTNSEADAFIAVGLTGEQYRIITETENPTYQVRFKILETIQEWK